MDQCPELSLSPLRHRPDTWSEHQDLVSCTDQKKREKKNKIKLLKLKKLLKIKNYRGFPGGAVVENLPANAGDTGSRSGLGRSHMPRSN